MSAATQYTCRLVTATRQRLNGAMVGSFADVPPESVANMDRQRIAQMLVKGTWLLLPVVPQAEARQAARRAEVLAERGASAKAAAAKQQLAREEAAVSKRKQAQELLAEAQAELRAAKAATP